MSKLCLIIICICTNCFAYNLLSPAQKLPQTIHYQCSRALEPRFLRCFAKWNKCVDDYFTLVEDDKAEKPDLMVVVADHDPLHPTWLAWTARTGTTAVISVVWPASGDEDDYDANHIMLHEIGHALGLDHSESHIMYKWVFKDTHYSLSDDEKQGVRSIYLKKD